MKRTEIREFRRGVGRTDYKTRNEDEYTRVIGLFNDCEVRNLIKDGYVEHHKHKKIKVGW